MKVARQKRKKNQRAGRLKAKAKSRYTKRRKASKHGKHEGRFTQFPA